MTNFIWPSDMDRAENDELNRVCEYLEEVLAQRIALEDAITSEGLEIGEYHSGFCITDASLARLKARWQAEILEEATAHFRAKMADSSLLCMIDATFLELRANELHRQAEEPTDCPGSGKCDDPGCPAHYVGLIGDAI